MRFLTKDFKQTKKLGRELAKEILESGLPEKAVIIGLKGDLGGGKTTFLQGFAKGLGIKENVLSPTFMIFRKYILSSPLKNFYHFDCYRIQDPQDLLALGFKEIVSDSRNIIAIEWVERVYKMLPQDIIMLEFEFVDENTRKISIKAI